MALRIVLLVGAGLMIRSTANLYGAPIGVNIADVLAMRVDLPEAKYPPGSRSGGFHRRLKTRLDALAGVEATAIVSYLPFGRWVSFRYEFEGKAPEPDRSPQIGGIMASPDYFAVMQVKPRRGRTFTDSYGITGSPVILVNESFAKKFWPEENALGKRLRLLKDRAAQPWLTVVGVLPDILQNRLHPLEHDPLIYLPYNEEPQREMFIASRTHIPPRAVADAFRRAVQDMDENLPVYDVRTLENRLAQTRLSVSLLGGMFSIFAGIALLLASVGLYAVITHSISQRTQEIGVRMAIGGTRGDILRLVYGQAMRPLTLGIMLGLPAAFGIARALRMLLIGVSPGDPFTFAMVVLVLALAGVIRMRRSRVEGHSRVSDCGFAV